MSSGRIACRCIGVGGARCRQARGDQCATARHAGSRQAGFGRGNRHRNRTRNPPSSPCSRTVRQAPAIPRPPPGRTWSCASKGGGWAVCEAARPGSRAAADTRVTNRSQPSSSGTGRTPALVMLLPRCDAAAAARGACTRSVGSLDRRLLPYKVFPGSRAAVVVLRRVDVIWKGPGAGAGRQGIREPGLRHCPVSVDLRMRCDTRCTQRDDLGGIQDSQAASRYEAVSEIVALHQTRPPACLGSSEIRDRLLPDFAARLAPRSDRNLPPRYVCAEVTLDGKERIAARSRGADIPLDPTMFLMSIAASSRYREIEWPIPEDEMG